MEEDVREEEEGRIPPPEPMEGDEWKSLSRVSNLPLVSGALRAYEQSKASSRVVKVRPPSLSSIPLTPPPLTN